MIDKERLEDVFKRDGFTDFKWMNTKDIVIAQWVRFRCMFGCYSYGKCGTCPPNVPTIEECKKMISEYNDVAVFHIVKQLEKLEDYKSWNKDTYLRFFELERKIFLMGFYKTFLIPFGDCDLCESCSGNRTECKHPRKARPDANALGIDVFSTVRSIGYPINVLKDYSETMHRYAFLLIE